MTPNEDAADDERDREAEGFDLEWLQQLERDALTDIGAVGFNAEQAEALAAEGFGVVDVLAALPVDVEEVS